MVSYRDLLKALRSLKIERTSPVIAHASLSSFGRVKGGPETMVGALLASFDCLLMPAFTYKTMLIPESGPDNNALVYGSGKDSNRMAEFFTLDMPVSRQIGRVPETLRSDSRSLRSDHPILSFCGVNADRALRAQTVQEPLAPIRVLTGLGGWVLLLGVNHTSDTSIHYAEKLAGRKQFTRWALTRRGVVECPGFPGCSEGFKAVSTYLEPARRTVRVGDSFIEAVPLQYLVDCVRVLVEEDPMALMCSSPDCLRCSEIKRINQVR
jgi:aminoglycoside 3-N-acetyltransferase